jgi:hypothetical protein
MELRVADREAARVRDLVGSHNRLHELIARDAPIGDVLGELVEGIERYEPSVMPRRRGALRGAVRVSLSLRGFRADGWVMYVFGCERGHG